LKCNNPKYFIPALATLVAFPVLVVLLSWLTPDVETWQHFSEYLLGDLIKSTLILVIGVALGVMILGTLLAYLVVMVDFPGRKWMEWALFLPFGIPAYVLAFVYLGVFDYSGYVQTFLRDYLGFPGFDIRSGSWATILTFILVFYPYVYMMTRASFMRQKISMIEAGKLLGAGPLRVFFKISLPIARPAVAAGVLVTIMETLADYGVVGLFNYNTFTTAIYSAWIDFRSVEVAAQLASILVISAFFLIYFEKKARGKAKYYSSDIYQERPYKASGLLGGLISFFVLGVFLLAFAMPMLQLVIWGHEMILEEWNTSYLDLIQSTLTLTSLAIIIVIFISTLLALPNDCKNSLVSRNLLRVSTLGYALPGSVMAVGLLYGVNEISSFAQIFGLASINYLIFGSITLLVFAYVSRFLAVGFNSIDASVQQIKPVLIDNARLLGAKRGKIIWKVYLPMMLPGILAASLLVGVDVMKELPATYLLRPFGWDTLAIKVYELSSEGLYERAAVPALIMVAIGAFMMLIFRSIDKKITL